MSTAMIARVAGALLALAPAILPPAQLAVFAMDGPTTISAVHPAHRAELPQGGTTILGHYRVITYYGAPHTAALGILGSKPPAQIATDIERRARSGAATACACSRRWS